MARGDMARFKGAGAWSCHSSCTSGFRSARILTLPPYLTRRLYTLLDERGLGMHVLSNWAADGARSRSSFVRVRPKAMQGKRVDDAHPPMALCSKHGTTVAAKSKDQLASIRKRREDKERCGHGRVCTL